MAQLPIIQAVINQRDDNGNAYAAVAETPPDALGDFVQAFLRYGLQDNRFGWAEIYKVKADGSKIGIGRVETLADGNLLKPDDLSLTVDTHTGDVRLAMSAHATSLVGGSGGTGGDPSVGEEPDVANAIVGRTITVAATEFPALWAVFPEPTPVPVPVPEPPPAPEPCGPDNLNYFRPNDFMTRAQVAQVVARSHGWEDEPDAQVFEDVLPGSTYYKATYNLKRRGIIGGYPCGRR